MNVSNFDVSIFFFCSHCGEASKQRILWFISGDRLNFVKVCSAVILIGGELLICQPFSLHNSNSSEKSNHLLGVGLAFAACVSGSLDGILVNMLKTEVHASCICGRINKILLLDSSCDSSAKLGGHLCSFHSRHWYFNHGWLLHSFSCNFFHSHWWLVHPTWCCFLWYSKFFSSYSLSSASIAHTDLINSLIWVSNGHCSECHSYQQFSDNTCDIWCTFNDNRNSSLDIPFRID